MSIQKKVVIAILITGFLALSTGLFITYYQVRNILTEAIGRDFAEIAKKTAERFDDSVKKEIKTFNNLSEESAFINAVKEKKRRNIEEYLIHYLRHSEEREEHLDLIVVDREGKIIADSKMRLNNKIDQSDSKWWRETHFDGKSRIYVSDIYLDELTGIRAMDIVIPVFDPETDRILGAIRNIMNVDVFFRFIKNMSFGKTGHGMLIDSEGTPLICSILPLVEHSMNEPLISLITGKGGGWAVAGDDAHGGENSIVGFNTLDFLNSLGSGNLGGHKWYTFIRQDPKETFTPVNKLLLNIILLESIIVLSICILGVSIVRRMLLRPLRLLHDGVERISKGNLEHKIDIRTGDEIERLANGFNRMSESVKGFYENLEDKIKERTTALRTSESKYRALMEQAYDAIFLIDPQNGSISETNLQAEVLTGLSQEELLNMKYWNMFPQSMINQAIDQFNRGVKRGFSSLHEVTIKRKNGETAWVDVSARLIEHNNMKVYHLVMRDLTERKKEEERQSMTNEQLSRSTMVMLEQDSKLSTLKQEMNSLIRQINMSDILVALFKIFANISGISSMGLFAYEGDVLQCVWSHGLDNRRLQNIIIEEDDPVNYAIRDLKIVKKGEFSKKTWIDKRFGDWMVFPLKGKDKVIGVLVAGSPGQITSPIQEGIREGVEVRLEVLQPLVDVMALVLEKENLIKRVKV